MVRTWCFPSSFWTSREPIEPSSISRAPLDCFYYHPVSIRKHVTPLLHHDRPTTPDHHLRSPSPNHSPLPNTIHPSIVSSTEHHLIISIAIRYPSVDTSPFPPTITSDHHLGSPSPNHSSPSNTIHPLINSSASPGDYPSICCQWPLHIINPPGCILGAWRHLHRIPQN